MYAEVCVCVCVCLIAVEAAHTRVSVTQADVFTISALTDQ